MGSGSPSGAGVRLTSYHPAVHLEGVGRQRPLAALAIFCFVVSTFLGSAYAAAAAYEIGAPDVVAAIRGIELPTPAKSAQALFTRVFPTIAWAPGESTKDGPELVGQAWSQQCAVVLDGPSTGLDEIVFYCRAEAKETLRSRDLYYLKVVAQHLVRAEAVDWFVQEVTSATDALSRSRGTPRVARYTTDGTHIKMSAAMLVGTRRQASIAVTAKGVRPLPPHT